MKALWKYSRKLKRAARLKIPGPFCSKEQNTGERNTSISPRQHVQETEHHQKVDQRYCKQMNRYKGIVAAYYRVSVVALMLHALFFSAFCFICGESVTLDIKALEGPEATLKEKTLHRVSYVVE